MPLEDSYQLSSRSKAKMEENSSVDLIPRRKNEKEIQKEIENYYSKPYIPSVKGGNRTELIKDLQTKFKSGRGALPKGAELPLPKADDDYDDYEYEEPTEDELRARAIEKVSKKYMKYTFEKGRGKENIEK
eukprot:CAMPEP_0114587662 /NCGR_PEP_ID=MMETSP0125-20121206/10570_1 /TAXON_ID=485358 ORGANISM="Aristerostoma sp., Strain ATCC 50986" /NCGR_SAMPLE_ID=MMETSP0125 /ASSEMBLY_ACC=CAM_ASM_000245 /LENGTH=130 /DNA_ID=CAMNT_0001783693 /DNA_START=322 /DNA_END=715 /DNA_ORIENTATION=-